MYQSPIELKNNNLIYINQTINLKGNNKGSEFDQSSKNFIVKDEIILELGGKIYELEEYHFHIKSEHIINNKIYPGELHYVFKDKSDNNNILVIGHLIKNTTKHFDLGKIKIKIPHKYYEYDGSLTVPEFSPAKWIINKKYAKLNINDIKNIAKTARPVQSLNNRIILCNCECIAK